MNIEVPLQPGDVIDNRRLCEIFRVSQQGGMRRGRETNSLVLVSNHLKSLYDDRWDDQGIMHYTGMGAKGDQSLTFMQNRTLAESPTNGVDIYLFEVFEPKGYHYVGQVELAGDPYPEEQLDEDGNRRQVWMFPLRVKDGRKPPEIQEAEYRKVEEHRQKRAKSLRPEVLQKRAQAAKGKPGRVSVSSTQYQRDPYVAEYAKFRAKGKCQLCGEPAPFRTKGGEPYLEVHHVVWLAKGGEDTLANTVALCPNCHRRIHARNDPVDIAKLQAVLTEMRAGLTHEN